MRWVDRLVIGQNICPYTRAVRQRPGALRIHVTDADTVTSDDAFLRTAVEAEVAALEQGAGETSLIVVPSSDGTWASNLQTSFPDWMSLGWAMEDVISTSTMPLQLALFHPHAVRSLYAVNAADGEDAEDYAMRSPYPTAHILRTADVEAVSGKSAAAIPQRNRQRLAAIGVEELRRMYRDLSSAVTS